MSSIGYKLTREREARGTSLDDVARGSGISRAYLEALERDEFAALPGRAFGKFYIRMYAEILGFDPSPLIAQYDETTRDAAEVAFAGQAPALDPSPLRTDLKSALRKAREARLDRREQPRDELPDELETESEFNLPVAVDEPPAILPGPAIFPVDSPLESSASEPAGNDASATIESNEGVEAARAIPSNPVAEAVESTETVGSRPVSLRRPFIALAAFGVLLIAALFVVSRVEPDAATADPQAEVPGEAQAGPATAAERAASIGVSEESRAAPPTRTSGESRAKKISITGPDVVTASATPRAAGAKDQLAGETATRLRVTQHGIGAGVRDRRLIDARDRFTNGEPVAFLTRIVGGRRGEKIRHVWRRGGGHVQTIELKLGGSHWRTHSVKTAWGVGSWTVEARDADGTLLATNSFEVVARRP